MMLLVIALFSVALAQPSRMNELLDAGVISAIIGGDIQEGGGSARSYEGARRKVPWFVSLKMSFDGGSEGQCGGAILDATHVVSACHCLYGPTSVVPLTDRARVVVTNHHSVTPLFEASGRATCKSEFQRSQANGDDLMVVTLSSPIPLDGVNVKAVRLASRNPSVGVMALTAGHGVVDHAMSRTSDALKTLRNPVEQCSMANVVCTRGIDQNRRAGNTCIGDSGGPLTVSDELVGVLSGGSPDCGRSTIDQAHWCSVVDNRAFIDRFMSGNTPQLIRSDEPPRMIRREPVQQQRPIIRREPVQQQRPIIRREPVQQAPVNFLRRGSCPNGRAPRFFYDSGCTAASGGFSSRVQCGRPPMPLGSMSSEQMRQMQSFPSQALRTGDVNTCCLATNNRFFCRGPRDGFAPGTPGVLLLHR